MKKIEWTDDLSVGIELIDSQHKTWIEYYNNTADAIIGQHAPEQIARTLGFLTNYTEVHFSTEEQAMQNCNYPDYQQHKAQHDALRKTLVNITNDFMVDCMADKLGEAVEKFLGNWLILHIRSTDIRFAAFTHNK